ncbi:MAG: hypothetical protein J6V93_02280 [Clostridia bacterium]|nr:hypothetical protein [Clostridia bacterium]
MKEIIKQAPIGMVPALDAEFEARKNKILATKSEWTLGEGGTVYYISSTDGCDDNDGLSEATPFKSCVKINEDGLLKRGDVVLFKRGDRFYTNIKAKPYVTYSAYGDGNKPMICGSQDASRPEDWERWGDNPHVYKYTGFIEKNIPNDEGKFRSIRSDIGNIVFNDGEYYGSRVMKYEDRDVSIHVGNNGLTSNGREFWYRGEIKFADANDLGHNLEFYFDYTTSELFLFSVYGNPGEVFERIDLCKKPNIIHGASGITLDNLCIRYGAAHGLGSGTANDVTVRNCEVGWIGGGLQFVNPNGWPTRFGNAIEIYGYTQNYLTYNCYVHQAFDCGPTIQWQGDLEKEDPQWGLKKHNKNIRFYGNAIERCDSPLEVWISTPTKPTPERFAKLEDIRIYDNLCRYSGYGFGGFTHQKCDYNMFYGAGATEAAYEDAYIENNFMWHIRLFVHFAVPTSTKQGLGFNWRNNVIIKPYASEFSLLGSDYENAKGWHKLYWYTNEELERLIDGGAIGENFFYHSMLTEGDRWNGIGKK